MYKLLTAIVITLGLAPTGAGAETAAELIKSFGLEGVWSPDCSGALRVKFEVTSSGEPKFVSIVEGHEKSIYQIKEATLLQKNQLRLKTVIARFESTSSPELTPQPGEIWEA